MEHDRLKRVSVPVSVSHWNDDNATFRRLVEDIRDYAIFMLDPDGRITTWNAGAQQAKGWAASEIIGQHFSVFYPPEVVAEGWPERELQIALAEGRCEDEGWRVRKDGTRFWASVVITALRDELGHHLGFAKVTRDLTDKRRVRALEDEGRRVTTFLAMLGHELRNPLAPIANAVSIMQLEHVESERVRICRDVIARQLQQITRLVDDLLDVGRITAGKIHIEHTPVELGGVLQEAVEAIEPFAHSRLHTLVLDTQAAPAWVLGDRARLLQIASNLLNNATKFTARGGRIVATLRVNGKHAELCVADNGPGIPAAQLQDIFNLFVQGGQDAARAHGGLGLGLSLVQQLATLHGGEVSAFSRGVGTGAEFVVRLPLAAAPSPTDDAMEAPMLPHAHLVLVVDDNRDAADTLATLLKTLGYRTRTAYDARSALESIRIACPELAILDIGLPDMDGTQLAHEIRDACGDAVQLVALTGYGKGDDATRAAGFVDHLTKPLSLDKLFAALSRAFPGQAGGA